MSRYYQDEDFDDGYGSNCFARECAAANVLAGHQERCSYSAGGDCGCFGGPDEEESDPWNNEILPSMEYLGEWYPFMKNWERNKQLQDDLPF